MGYLDENLLTDEIVLYRVKPHWIIFLPALTWLAISCALIIFGAQVPFLDTLLFTSLPLNVLAALAAALLAILYALGSLVIYITSEFGITTKRVLMKTGLINRISVEIMLSRIESIQGLMVTKKGFSKNDVNEASADNIDLLVIREQRDQDWDGRLKTVNVRLYIQQPARTISISPRLNKQWALENGYTEGE